jgi:uncharacterized membrane protein
MNNLPQILDYVETITPVDERRSHWVLRGHPGERVEFDAEIANESPDQFIAWRTLDAPIECTCSLSFTPIETAEAGPATEVHLILRLIAPPDRAADLIARDPTRTAQELLLRFKQRAESQASATPTSDVT